MSLRKIKLSTKLYVGFGLLLVILLGVSLLSWKELDNASVGFKDYRGLARDTNLTGRLQANMLMVRMNVKDFIITGSEKDHQEYAEYLKKMNGFLETSLREIKAPKRAANIQEMARIVKDYEKGFELVVKEQGERDRLVNSVLNLRGPEMERLLSKLMENARQEKNAELIYQAGETLRSLLLARLYVMKFLDTNQQAAVDRVNKEFKSFQEGLARVEAQAASADQKELAQGVRKIDGEYLKAFGQVVEAIYDRNKIVKNTLDKIGPQVAGLVEDVKLSIKAEQDELGPRLQAGNEQAVTLILIIALAALLAGGLMAWVLTRSITRPIQNVIQGLSEGAAQVASAAGQVANAGQSLAAGAAQQASSLEETSASMEEMASMTRSNSDNAGQADSTMQETSRLVEKANGSMADLRRAMEQISQASDETAKIIKTIDEIAFQTNLLALNAAVEAARAGEAGAGFAVVADEVRNLAMRAAEAAKNTAGLIEQNINDIKQGTEVVQSTDQAFAELGGNAAKVAELVAEIASASREQTQGIDQVNQALGEMDKVTQQNAANAEESAAASEELSSQAEVMQGFVANLVELVGGAGNGRAGRADTETSRAPARPRLLAGSGSAAGGNPMGHSNAAGETSYADDSDFANF